MEQETRMNENNAGKKEKKPVQILRERCGGASKELMEQHRAQRKIQKQLKQALKEGPKTVPEIAKQTGIPSHDVLWHLMSMKKYGQIVEGQERESYYEYRLEEQE